jgi:hypothetical protein
MRLLAASIATPRGSSRWSLLLPSTVVAGIDGHASVPTDSMFGPLSVPTDSCLVRLPLGDAAWGWPKGSFCAYIERLHSINSIVQSIDAPSSVVYTATSSTCILKATCSTYLEGHSMSAKFMFFSAGARTCVFHPLVIMCTEDNFV